MAISPDSVRRGAVVLVRLPGDKSRPAIVVRSDLLAGLAYATVLPVTTELREDVPDLRINLTPEPGTGLREASQVMVDWPQTIRLERMGEAIGWLDPTIMRTITRQMAFVLGIGAGAHRRSYSPP
jgi:mRNA interferase MazF